MQPFYLLSVDTHPTSPTHTAFINKWLVLCEPGHAETAAFKKHAARAQSATRADTHRIRHAWTTLNCKIFFQAISVVASKNSVRYEGYIDKNKGEVLAKLYTAHCGSGPDESW